MFTELLIVLSLAAGFVAVLVTPGLAQTTARSAIALCEVGRADACEDAGRRFYNGDGIGADKSRAAHYYKIACELDQYWSCGELGLMYFYGNGVSGDKSLAVGFLEKSCSLGGLTSCVNVGGMYFRGDGTRQDDRRASQLYKSACDGGNAWGCYKLAFMVQNGFGVQLNNRRANELYHLSCERGESDACYRAAENHALTLTVQRYDREKVLFYLRAACALGDEQGCSEAQRIAPKKLEDVLEHSPFGALWRAYLDSAPNLEKEALLSLRSEKGRTFSAMTRFLIEGECSKSPAFAGLQVKTAIGGYFGTDPTGKQVFYGSLTELFSGLGSGNDQQSVLVIGKYTVSVSTLSDAVSKLRQELGCGKSMQTLHAALKTVP